jgi:hypothetical protein
MWSELGHRIVWYIHGYECLGGAFWVCHTGHHNRSGRSRPYLLCWPLTMHGPITEKTAISNHNIIHFSCTVSLCYKTLHPHVRQYIALLFYITLWFEQKCVAGNIIKNSSTVYCVMSVCSCVVMVLKLYIFSIVTHCSTRRGVVMLWRMATLPTSCYVVRKITTVSVPQSYAGYLRTSQVLEAL